jgi:cobalt-zinc-cadmium efflux system membrane fusion protein
MKATVLLPLGALAIVLSALGVALLAGGGRRPRALEAASPPAASDSVIEPRVEGERLILPSGSPQLRSVTSAVVTTADLDSVRLGGRLVWNEDVTVRVFSPFAGRVVRVLVDAGRAVRAGDTLALITAPDFGQAQADARKAAADLALAERTSTRVRDLFQHGIVAQRDVDGAEADLARARAEEQRARDRLAMYGADSGSTGQVFPLRAPLGGIVVERSITPGQEIRPDQMLANAPQLFAPLFVITDPSHLWAILDLPERDLPRVAAGQSVVVRTLALMDRAFAGRIALVAGAVDPTTRTIKVRAVVANPTGLLRAEMLVSVVLPGEGNRGLVVPDAAVLLEGGGHVLFIEEGAGRFRRAAVSVGAEQSGLITVLGGLRPGDRVVTSGALLLEQLFQSSSHS